MEASIPAGVVTGEAAGLTSRLHEVVTTGVAAATATKMEAQSLEFYYGATHALKNINMAVQERRITALIGPSGCGKSTFLRTLNRMNELIPNTRLSGRVLLDGAEIYGRDVDVVRIRQRVGMVFQRPNPFPKSIFDNVAYGPRVLGLKKEPLPQVVERSLRQAALWDEVKDRLRTSALGLSGGQQQRLCIARVLAVEPEVILMDEPASALDPISTTKIEDLLRELRPRYTIVIVTHNLQQAARISDDTGFFLSGDLVEFGPTSHLFVKPQDKRTEDYITGRFG
jgi:phosphate transport system ATP-binding protein